MDINIPEQARKLVDQIKQRGYGSTEPVPLSEAYILDLIVYAATVQLSEPVSAVHLRATAWSIATVMVSDQSPYIEEWFALPIEEAYQYRDNPEFIIVSDAVTPDRAPSKAVLIKKKHQ